uniref:Uncharacterized protein n=1 Tax=Timema tahoe TaxID=61484 RepID=A0A7R9IJP6_9NEOP|nr:unnamed protein product [Timema tahoe]
MSGIKEDTHKDGASRCSAMSELQATVEFCVELYKFYNVDLFQRGCNNNILHCFPNNGPRLGVGKRYLKGTRG